MASIKPLLIFMGILIGVFIFVNLFVTPIYNVDEIQPTGSVGTLINIVDNGWTFDLPFLGNSTIKPVSWFYFGSETVENFLVTQLTYLSIFPNIILTPMIILLIGSLAWTVLIIIKDIIPFT